MVLGVPIFKHFRVFTLNSVSIRGNNVSSEAKILSYLSFNYLT